MASYKDGKRHSEHTFSLITSQHPLATKHTFFGFSFTTRIHFSQDVQWRYYTIYVDNNKLENTWRLIFSLSISRNFSSFLMFRTFLLCVTKLIFTSISLFIFKSNRKKMNFLRLFSFFLILEMKPKQVRLPKGSELLDVDNLPKMRGIETFSLQVFSWVQLICKSFSLSFLFETCVTLFHYLDIFSFPLGCKDG